MPVVYAALGHKVVKAEDFQKDVKNLKAVVKTLNDHLKERHFMVGDNLTIADVVVACSLIMPF